MSQLTFDERCLLAEQCLPDAPYRAMLTKLHAEMLEALAKQPAQQEPVLFIHPSTLEMASAHVGAWKPGHELPGYIALYTSPPQRQPLTEEEIDKLAMDSDGTPNSHIEFARAIEAAHEIKEKIE